MQVAVVWSSVGAYLLLAGLLLRPIYGRLRANAVDDIDRRQIAGDAVAYYGEHREADTMLNAVGGALVWPGVVILWAVTKWAFNTKTQSRYERELTKAEHNRRLKKFADGDA